ncbi:MAG TPA: hypothetical protein DCF73_19130 [Rhodobiaceae bacterium]|nr:hypothetical protein [Rhodobiaceae bacterium]
MAGTRLYLHIGAGKCGSSSIQTALTRSPAVGDIATYAKIARDGSIKVRPSASRETGYTASINVDTVDPGILPAISTNLGAAIERAGPLILSYEGWHNRVDMFRKHRLLEGCGPVTVIYYVRAPVGYVNSAWWQWGVWKGWTIEKAMTRFTNHARYGLHARAWAELPEVERVICRPVAGDVVPDFFSLFGVNPPEMEKTNVTLPGGVLRLMQRNPDLWKSHRLNFLLGDAFTSREPAPWVLAPDQIGRIIEETRESTEMLQEFMDPDAWSKIRDDALWWDANAYAGKRAENPYEGEVANADTIAADLLKHIAGSRR